METSNDDAAHPAQDDNAEVPDTPGRSTPESDGPVEKVKDAFGKLVGGEGDRHGSRDTDPGH